MWSWHFYWGLNFGFEIYEDMIEDDPVEYFLINIGCLRIQRAEYV